MMEELIVDFPRAPLQAKHRVSFTDSVGITEVDNLSCQYKDDLWFTSCQIRGFKRNAALVLRRLATMNITMAQYAEMNVEDTSVFMGLESYMTEVTAREIRHQRQKVRQAVLLEQQRQNCEGVYDPEAMSSISGAASEWGRVRARVIGKLHDSQRV